MTANKAKQRQMRFTDAEWAQLTKLGRAKWIREQLLQLSNK